MNQGQNTVQGTNRDEPCSLRCRDFWELKKKKEKKADITEQEGNYSGICFFVYIAKYIPLTFLELNIFSDTFPPSTFPKYKVMKQHTLLAHLCTVAAEALHFLPEASGSQSA